MTRHATIETYNIGQRFGCAGRVVAADGEVLYRTDDLPYGMQGVAFGYCRDWAAEHNVAVKIGKGRL